MFAVHTARTRTMHPDTHTHNMTPLPPRAVTSPTFPEARLDSKPSVTFIMREYVSKRLTSLFSTSAPFGRCIHFSEPAWIFQGWVTDPVKNEKRDEVGGMGREVRGGTGNHICLCRSHKWLKPCRFQSDYHSSSSSSSISISDFPLSPHIPLISCRYAMSEVNDEPEKNFDGGWAQLYCTTLSEQFGTYCSTAEPHCQTFCDMWRHVK